MRPPAARSPTTWSRVGVRVGDGLVTTEMTSGHVPGVTVARTPVKVNPTGLTSGRRRGVAQPPPDGGCRVLAEDQRVAAVVLVATTARFEHDERPFDQHLRVHHPGLGAAEAADRAT